MSAFQTQAQQLELQSCQPRSTPAPFPPSVPANTTPLFPHRHRVLLLYCLFTSYFDVLFHITPLHLWNI